VAEESVLGRHHDIGVPGLIEMPAVAVALGLDDADLLELLQAPATGSRFRIVLAQPMDIPERVLARVLHVRVVDLELMQERWVAAPLVGITLLVEITARAEVIACAADDQDLDVIIDVGAVNEVSVQAAACRPWSHCNGQAG
jgi:hypothetical protein